MSIVINTAPANLKQGNDRVREREGERARYIAFKRRYCSKTDARCRLETVSKPSQGPERKDVSQEAFS